MRTTLVGLLALACLLASLLALPAHARRPDLRVKRLPTAQAPRSLHMRADAGAAGGSQAGRAQAPAPAAVPIKARRVSRFERLPTGLSDLSERVTFRIQLGYGADQAQTYENAQLSSGVPLDSIPFRQTRLYGFGDLVAGTRGILMPSLLTYFAAHFHLDQDGTPSSSSAPTVYDGATDSRAALIRAAHAQFQGLGGRWLQPLFVRAGRQFRYGLAISHFDGVTAAYETRPVEFTLFFGRRVSLYGPGSDPFALGRTDPGRLGGVGMVLRLASITKVPLTLGGEFFQFDGDGHFEATLRADPRRDIQVTATGRVRGSQIAHFRAGLRARLGTTATLALEVDQRQPSDWVYDMIVPGNTAFSDTDARRYLNLGPEAGRLRVGLRAGTMLWDNLDILLFAAVQRQDGEIDDQATAISPTHGELGVGVEGRFRGGLSAGGELRARRFIRPDGTLPERMAFGDTGASGERSFDEASGEIRYALGQRRFAAVVEGYLRRSKSATPFELDDAGQLLETVDARGGGRFRIEGWVARRLHVLAEYELTGVPDRLAPEMAGLQSIRLILEGSF